LTFYFSIFIWSKIAFINFEAAMNQEVLHQHMGKGL
jgi:hypothetical protein